MITLPESERVRFESQLRAHSRMFGLEPAEYLRKVWYHENAARLGEYAAMIIVEDLVRAIPTMFEGPRSGEVVDLNATSRA